MIYTAAEVYPVLGIHPDTQVPDKRTPRNPPCREALWHLRIVSLPHLDVEGPISVPLRT